MFVRVVSVKRNGRVLQYAQLVESYRRESDGKPAHRVIASLGRPEDPLVANVRQALAATREGKRLAPVVAARGQKPPKPDATLRFLDLAVVLELWREWELDQLLDELLPQGQECVRPADVVAALVFQRCVDPGSKLFATRWLPRTALVELLGISPAHFNNTRLHRVLEELDAATPRLMAKLPARYGQRGGAFASLFLDVTDTWFVGHGCESAEYGKTKEGLVKRKIGIVLLCNEHGYPLRWEVIQGSRADNKAMLSTMKHIAGMSWAHDVPLVCDRAMGNTKTVTAMASTGLRFITALNENEFDTYAPRLALQELATLDVDGDEDPQRAVERAADVVTQAGLEKVDDTLFVLDVGLVERTSEPDPGARAESSEDITIVAMRYCRQIEEMVARSDTSSFRDAARRLGLTPTVGQKYRQLRTLSEQQQRDVLDGKLAGHTITQLMAVAKISDREEQQRAFEALLRSAPRHDAPRPARKTQDAAERSEPLQLRVVACFNPERFVQQRKAARERLGKIEAFVAELNASLASPRSKHTEKSVAAKIDRKLHEEGLLEAYDVQISREDLGGKPRLSVSLSLKPAQWARRRRFDGFSVLVAHPSLPQSASELCRLYRSKDAVEKDFQVIKGLVALRPVRHHTDAKVRAHVTLCMLALLLERTLGHKLRKAKWSAAQALAILQSCQLNQYNTAGASPAYIITATDPEQAAILGALRWRHLADDDAIAGQITPR